VYQKKTKEAQRNCHSQKKIVASAKNKRDGKNPGQEGKD